MHSVVVLAMHGVIPFDLSMPSEIFGRAQVDRIRQPYAVRVCGEAKEIKAGDFDLKLQWTLEDAAGANTLIVPGIVNPTMPISQAVIDTIRAAAANGARIASICTGAFVLAATGLLNGMRATTHWMAADELASRYPLIEVDPNVLFVDNGLILTSAGAAAGIDLCLHMVRNDYGSAVAANCARISVAPLERAGGQTQFILHEPPGSTSSLSGLLEWMNENLESELNLPRIARKAGMSSRTLSRKFYEQTGTTPLQWILKARIRRAQLLLESTTLSVEQIASEVGFDAATSFRERFCKLVGASPTSYRKTFGGHEGRSLGV
jgi:transcriptional regulator GlxA family with amidase domain